MSDEVERFIAVARAFCSLLESATELELRDLRARLLVALPELYLAGLALPLPETDVEAESVSLKLDLLVGLAQHLGEHDAYWVVFDPTQREAPIQGSLAQDLSEIRFDLQQGLVALDQGALLEAVVWEWRFGLDSHWGNHLVDAFRAIHHQRGW